MSRARRDVVLVVLGAISLLLLALGIVDGRWLGLLTWPVGLADQLLHLIAGLGSILVGLAGLGAFEMSGRSTPDPDAVTAAVPSATSEVTTTPAPSAALTTGEPPSAAPAASSAPGSTSAAGASRAAPSSPSDAPASSPPEAPVPSADEAPADASAAADPDEPAPDHEAPRRP
jgi:hypothetical protein